MKRLQRYHDEVFTFLHNPEVPFDNNFGERSIRGAVIMRKNIYNNRSDRGARTQSILMSGFFTLKQRGLHPVATVKKALSTSSKPANNPNSPTFLTVFAKLAQVSVNKYVINIIKRIIAL